MILDYKVPPPAYSTATTAQKPTAGALPSHLVLLIVYHTFPASSVPDADHPERSRKVLFWLSDSLRLTNRAFYTASMHVLRSTYLHLYQLRVKPPYTSDPFPASLDQDRLAPTTPAYPSPSASTTSFLSTLSHPSAPNIFFPLQRETKVLDRFIALKVREDVFVDDSELHLEREDYFRDLFDIEQPRARLEDLIRIYGFEAGAVSVPGMRRQPAASRSLPPTPRDEKPISPNLTFDIPESPTPSYASLPTPPSSPLSPSAAGPGAGSSTYRSSPAKKPLSKLASLFKRGSSSSSSRPSTSQVFLQPPPVPDSVAIKPIPISALTVSLSPRRVGLVLNRSRTIVEVSKAPGRKETLETLAQEVVRLLVEYLEES